MANSQETARQIKTLAGELEQALEETQQRHDELSRELTTRQQELETAEKRIESLVQKLKAARQEAANAQVEVQEKLRQRLATLETETAAAKAELDQERSIRKRLEKGAAADEKRLNELEKALAGQPPSGPADVTTADDAGKTATALRDALATVEEERRQRERAEEKLAETVKIVENLEQALIQAAKTAPPTATADERLQTEALQEKLKDVEAQLAQERLEGLRNAKAYVEAERRLAILEAGRAAHDAGPAQEEPSVVAAAAAPIPPAQEKALPHMLRPAPKPGVPFHPDWDLQALPCKTADQVLHLWCSVANVQLSLEGYPSQYCAAFLAVIKEGKHKKLYLFFNLKTIRHVLFCIPASQPTDEESLQKLIREGQRYLEMSGFELEKIRSADIQERLDRYFSA